MNDNHRNSSIYILLEVDMNRDIAISLVLSAFFAVSGCAHLAVPEHEPPSSGSGVTVTNQGIFGISTSTCQLPGASPVCRASMLLVDGRRLPITGSATTVSPGKHVIRVQCSYWRGGPAFLGSMDAISMDLELQFIAGQEYYVRGKMDADRCEPSIADSIDGPSLGSPLPFGAAKKVKTEAAR
ncbi:MAG: hypothetical protein ACXWAC_11535 [Usitatibacter sp.]